MKEGDLKHNLRLEKNGSSAAVSFLALLEVTAVGGLVGK
jgi:hypothetical protein